MSSGMSKLFLTFDMEFLVSLFTCVTTVNGEIIITCTYFVLSGSDQWTAVKY